MIKAKTVTELWKVEDKISQIVKETKGDINSTEFIERIEAQVKIAFELGRKEEREVQEEKRLEAEKRGEN